MPKPLKLTVFLDESASLLQMDTTGTLDRELAVYRELQKRGIQMSVVSYGGRDEFDFAKRISGMRILCNWLGLPKLTYIRRIHQIHAPPLLAADLLKAHESVGHDGCAPGKLGMASAFHISRGLFLVAHNECR